MNRAGKTRATYRSGEEKKGSRLAGLHVGARGKVKKDRRGGAVNSAARLTALLKTPTACVHDPEHHICQEDLPAPTSLTSLLQRFAWQFNITSMLFTQISLLQTRYRKSIYINAIMMSWTAVFLSKD